ncbi:glycosyltransferase [Acidithiobacillus ferrivorans]|nr:glycosyltransferase [Acidithiobacillus ferrivorans]
MTKIENVSVIVPTLNSAKYIGILLEMLAEHFSEVIVGIDSKTSDNTLNIVKMFPVKSVIVPNNLGHTAEHGMIEFITKECTNEWILRLDDDESISNQLIEFLRLQLNDITECCVGFHRKWCRVNQSRLEWMALPDFGFDWQWRLFRRNEVTYIMDIHTPGYSFESSICAPIEACILHLDWIFHTYEERLKKIKNYDAVRRDSGRLLWHYYLYEDIINYNYYFVKTWGASIPKTLKDRIATFFPAEQKNPVNINAARYINAHGNQRSCLTKIIHITRNYFLRIIFHG